MAGSAKDVLFKRGEESEESDAWDDTALIKAYDDAVSAMKAQLAETNPEFAPLVKPKAKKKKRNRNKKKLSAPCQWNVGDLCQAVFTEDSEVYEARILATQPSQGTCTVQYLGYGNEEEQEMTDLLPPAGVASSQRTDTASEAESVNPEPATPMPVMPKSRKSKRHARPAPGPPVWGAPMPGHPLPVPPFGQMPPPQMLPPFQAPGFPSFPPQGPIGAASAHMYPGAPPSAPYPGVPPPPPLFPQPGPGSEGEAMYSMLISWYMSGYHTGFYQGLKQAGNGPGPSPHR